MMKRFISTGDVYVHGIKRRFETEYKVVRPFDHKQCKFTDKLMKVSNYGIFPMPWHYKENSEETYDEYMARIEYYDMLVTQIVDYGIMGSMAVADVDKSYYAWQKLNYHVHTIQRAFKKNLVMKRKIRTIHYFLEQQRENKFLGDELVLRNMMPWA